MELIAGDGRIVKLAEIADLGDDAAELIVLLDGLAHGSLGGVDAQAVSHGLYDLEHELCLVVVKVRLIAFHGGIDLRYEELFVLNGIDQEEVLLHTLHGRAALRAEQAAQIVVSALDRALENGAGIGTGPVGHVVACDVGGCAVWCAEP